VSPRLGGDTAAERFLELVTTFDQNPTLDSFLLAKIQSEALDAARNQNDEIARRWLWLAEKAARRRFTQAQ
jgi:hypothetical protein